MERVPKTLYLTPRCCCSSIDTADVPYMGRSISYQHPNPRSIIPHAPSISSLPFLSSSTRRSLSSPPLPRLPHEDFYSDDGTTGTGSTHSAGSSTASLHSSRSSSSSRRSPRPRSEKVLPPPPASSAPMSRYLSNGSSGMSKQTIESLKYTTKFPDRWISTSNEGEDARLLWDDNSDEVRGGRRTWTGHKTFLLGSVATVSKFNPMQGRRLTHRAQVFAYGMAGIIGVILTYFRSEFPLLKGPFMIILTNLLISMEQRRRCAHHRLKDPPLCVPRPLSISRSDLVVQTSPSHLYYASSHP
jgi:hypothetical protein